MRKITKIYSEYLSEYVEITYDDGTKETYVNTDFPDGANKDGAFIKAELTFETE